VEQGPISFDDPICSVVMSPADSTVVMTVPINGGDRDELRRRYLFDLTQYDLERINQEPQRQAAEQARLKSEIQQLAITNYR